MGKLMENVGSFGWEPKAAHKFTCGGVCKENDDCVGCPIQEVFDRLAAYEGIGTVEQCREAMALYVWRMGGNRLTKPRLRRKRKERSMVNVPCKYFKVLGLKPGKVCTVSFWCDKKKGHVDPQRCQNCESRREAQKGE